MFFRKHCDAFSETFGCFHLKALPVFFRMLDMPLQPGDSVGFCAPRCPKSTDCLILL